MAISFIHSFISNQRMVTSFMSIKPPSYYQLELFLIHQYSILTFKCFTNCTHAYDCKALHKAKAKAIALHRNIVNMRESTSLVIKLNSFIIF
jgi:hypothetical protein